MEFMSDIICLWTSCILDIWEPKIGDEHCLKGEPNNKEDSNAITVVHKKQSSSMSERSTRLQMKTTRSFVHPNEMTDNMEVISHIPKLMAQWVIIKGKHINRGVGYGVEFPCEFKFQGLVERQIKRKKSFTSKTRSGLHLFFFILEYCWTLITYTCCENYFNCYLRLIVNIVSDNLSSVCLREIDFPIGTSSKVFT